MKIFDLHHIDEDINPELYAFAYLRAERLGLRAIHRRLDEVNWLPTHVDITSEHDDQAREKMSRWVKSEDSVEPTSDSFGNDFIHTLTRCALRQGWDQPEFTKLANRIGFLFRDLAYLVATIYCCNVLKEWHVEEVTLSDPKDLARTAKELTHLMRLVTQHPPEIPQAANKEAKKKPDYLRLVTQEELVPVG